MEAANFLTEFDVPRYNVTQVTLAANGIYTLNQTFDMIAILELSGSAVLSFNDQTESDCDAGIQFRAPLGGRFSRVSFRETAGAACNIRVLTAFGNVSDSRSNISGNLSVQNAASPNDSLEVNLLAADAGLVALANAIIAAHREDTLLRARLTTLAGATYSRTSDTGSQEIVSAAANTAGVIIRRAVCHSDALEAHLSIGGNVLLGADGDDATGHYELENYFVPAGVAIAAVAESSTDFVDIWYEVL
jgi:hypothetical protein